MLVLRGVGGASEGAIGHLYARRRRDNAEQGNLIVALLSQNCLRQIEQKITKVAHFFGTGF
jgi:hypothetical protein